MEGLFRNVAGALVCFLVAGWSSAGCAASDKYANVHTIGVVSALGQTLTIADNSIFNFMSAKSALPIADWGLDQRITQEVGASLSPRFAIRAVSYDPAAFRTIHPGSFFGWSGIDWKRAIRTMGSDGVDAYVVVLPITLQDPIDQTRAQMPGIGLYGSIVFAFYAVVVVDARTGDVIDHADAQIPKRGWLGSQSIPPYEDTKDPSLGDSDVLSSEHRQRAKATAESLIDRSINRALADTGLIDDSQKLVPASPPEPAAAQTSSPQSTR